VLSCCHTGVGEHGDAAMARGISGARFNRKREPAHRQQEQQPQAAATPPQACSNKIETTISTAPAGGSGLRNTGEAPAHENHIGEPEAQVKNRGAEEDLGELTPMPRAPPSEYSPRARAAPIRRYRLSSPSTAN